MIIACIADDFTGASDIASFFAKGGLQTVLINGIPKPDFNPGESVQAVVIALKTRSIDKAEAVQQSLKAYAYLEKQGCRQLYFKYCSTFDCTPEGNIGPVTDALIKKTASPYTILCPALPVNGRRVKDGGLFVNGIPLHESPLKDHPLNPMWDYKIAKLMENQGQFACINLRADEIENIENIEEWIKNQDGLSPDKPFYIVPDYFEDSHGYKLASLFKELPLITGGSGLAEHLAAIHLSEMDSEYAASDTYPAGTEGRSIIFAGSCSKASREQVRLYKESGGKAIELNADNLKNNPDFIQQLFSDVQNDSFSDLLIHTRGNSDCEKQIESDISQEEISRLFETTMADLAEMAVDAGVSRIIIAGGETSGAVTERLGFQSFIISSSVAPGVPILIPVQNKRIRLVLKSGNFGQPDFFKRALEKTES